MSSISDTFETAFRQHQSGQLHEAENTYRQILAAEPRHIGAWYCLSLIARQLGHQNESERCLLRAVKLSPSSADANIRLAAHFLEYGNAIRALTDAQKAVETNPASIEANFNLARALRDLEKTDEAIRVYQRVVELSPAHKEAHTSLGDLLRFAGRLDESIACAQRLVNLYPDFAEGFNNLGAGLQAKGRLAEAIACYQSALAIDPQAASVFNNWGTAARLQGNYPQATACLINAIHYDPTFVAAYNNLGVVLNEQARVDEAVTCYLRVLELAPDSAEAYRNLGIARKNQARVKEAIACFRQAIAIKPTFQDAYSSLLLTLAYCPEQDASSIYEVHREWARLHADPLARLQQPHTNDPLPHRRLRIGYVSADFRASAHRFFDPLFANHDHNDFEIFCYSNVASLDDTTAHLRALTDKWSPIKGISDEDACQLIRSDQIDILIDLNMHAAGGRPLLFARKPAPVQVAWFAYPGTTGQTTIDYRLTDPYLDPPGVFDRFYSEKSIRLPNSFWCCGPLNAEPEASPLPALTTGHITFGCLNNFCKINDGVLDLWASVMRAVAGSHLLMIAPEGSSREYVIGFLNRHEVFADRITFVSRQSLAGYLATYHQIDIALETWPYNGHTTSLDAFWMGVPVPTLVGHTVVGRAGLSLLKNLGLSELVAYTPDDYLRILRELAIDLPRLSQLRAELRVRLQQSSLMNAPQFVSSIESAYREMWHNWCKQRSPH